MGKTILSQQIQTTMLEQPLFNKLPTWSQVEVLRRQGTVVGQRQHKGWHITLYLLEKEFVEVWTKQGLSIAGSFDKSAKALAILEPYTESITVEEPYSNF